MGRLESVRSNPVAYGVMGACGSGKSTIAHEIAKAMGIRFLDADDFHPPSNVEKMRAGTPLTDEDRAGWLRALNEALRVRMESGESVVVACSALKQSYRDALGSGGVAIRWIYLKGSRETLLERVGMRRDHFMPTSLVDSQLATLEEPAEAIVLDIRLSVSELVGKCLSELGLRNEASR